MLYFSSDYCKNLKQNYQTKREKSLLLFILTYLTWITINPPPPPPYNIPPINPPTRPFWKKRPQFHPCPHFKPGHYRSPPSPTPTPPLLPRPKTLPFKPADDIADQAIGMVGTLRMLAEKELPSLRLTQWWYMIFKICPPSLAPEEGAHPLYTNFWVDFLYIPSNFHNDPLELVRKKIKIISMFC